MPSPRAIQLRGVEVHNLKRIDLDLPQGRLIVFCGVSGSGKSSLAFDTLYAEGQRRYIESFSAYTRQFLARLERPAAERIDGIPPAIAVEQGQTATSSRSTVATATEIHDYLRLLFARVGHVHCRQCGREVRRDGPQSVANWAEALPAGTRLLVCVQQPAPAAAADWSEQVAALRAEGYVRAAIDGEMRDLSADPGEPPTADWLLVVDRLTVGSAAGRLRDSVEAAFARSDGRCAVLVDDSRESKMDAATAEQVPHPNPPPRRGEGDRGKSFEVDGVRWVAHSFSNRLACDACGVECIEPEPRLFSYNSPVGACPRCEGFGNVMDIDLDLVVPDRSKSLREGAIAPWNTPAYAHELEELLALAGDYDLPVDVPYSALEPRHVELIQRGVPERNFGGLDGFFAWLERRKYKMHIRVFHSRWRSYRVCPGCGGARLRPEALAVRVGGRNIADVSALKVADAAPFFGGLALPAHEQTIARTMLAQIASRLRYLAAVGLAYLPLDRTLRTLSGGEAQRTALAAALGSSLVGMLYVLDEPTVGLHPADTARLIDTVRELRDRGNTVIVVDHEEPMIRAADQCVEIGPGAGDRGGRVVFQGTPAEMEASPDCITGDYLAGRRAIRAPERRRAARGWIRLVGARGNNLKNLTLEFPLGVLCVVTGVSGAGKSTLVQDTLYPALCRRMRKEAERPLDFDDVYGDGQLQDVMLVDQSPVGRSPRSNPVTYVKAFDEIRAVFAETLEARTRNYTASHFSFNVEGGRCGACDGDGYQVVDMQFLADVYMRCEQCGGTRYRKEILDVKHRGRSIAEVLEMTVREAFGFFRGHPKVQARLKRLMDVGLDYLRLGQPANTLSGGEAQRLKLAGYVASARRGRTLFILDEPTTGLHFYDIVQLLDCFEALLAVGHSLIVVEHNLALVKCADWVIDLGPGAADQGGRLVAQGTPEAISRERTSITGRYLAEVLEREAAEVAASEK
jgi:excinuclease ABC subunit A